MSTGRFNVINSDSNILYLNNISTNGTSVSSAGGTTTIGSSTPVTVSSSGVLTINNTTSSTSPTTGAIVSSGGIAGTDVIISNRISTLGYMYNSTTAGTAVYTGLKALNKKSKCSRATAKKAITNTWYTRSTPITGINHICWSPELSLFVGATDIGDNIVSSLDGITWTSRSVPTLCNIRTSVCWSAELNLFVMGCSSISNTDILTSSDGITWLARTTPTGFDQCMGVCFSPELSLFVATSLTSPYIIYSSNGITWSSATVAGQCSAVCWSPELKIFVVQGYNTTYTSSNGTTWTTGTAIDSFNNPFNGLCWSPELYMFVMAIESNLNGAIIYTSQDGLSWTTRFNPGGTAFSSCIWISELSVFAVIQEASVYYSFNGIDWSNTSVGDSTNMCLAWSPELSLFTVGTLATSNVYTSTPALPSSLNTIKGPSSQIYLNPNNGQLGLNQPSPGYLLDVNGTSRFTGISTITNTTASTSSSLGAILSSGGISISNTTDAVSATNGGTFTTAGGTSIAKKLFVGTDTNLATVSGITTIGSTTAATISAAGLLTVNNATASTSNTLGALLSSGGISISNTTDAVSATNGGTFTTAGGVAIAKKLYVGTDTNLATASGVTTIGSTTAATISAAGLLTVNNATAAAITSSGSVLLTGSGSLENLQIRPTSGFGATILLNAATSLSGTSFRIFSSGSTSGEGADKFVISDASHGNPVPLQIYRNSCTMMYYNNSQAQSGIGLDVNSTCRITGITTISNTTDSGNISSGALIVSGGVGITKSLYIGGPLDILSSKSGIPTTTGVYLRISASTFTDTNTANSGTAASMVFNSIAVPTLASTGTVVTTTNAATFYIAGGPTAGTNETITNSYGIWNAGKQRIDGITVLTSNVSSTTTTSGSLVVTGGIGVSENIYSGGTLNNTGPVNLATASGTTTIGNSTALTISTAGVLTVNNLTSSTSSITGSAIIKGGLGVAENIYSGGTLNNTGAVNLATASGVTTIGNITAATISTAGLLTVNNLTSSTSSITGSAIIKGGLGVAENVYSGGTLNSTGAANLATASGQTSIGATTAATISQLGVLTVNNLTSSTSSITGSAIIKGGLGVAENIYSGGTLNNTGPVNLATASGVTTIGNITAATISTAGLLTVNNATDSSGISSGSINTLGGLGITKSVYIGGELSLTNTNLGVKLNAADRPLITRGHDQFSSGNYTGLGRWGLFMEAAALTLGLPATLGALNVSTYNANSTVASTYFSVSGNTGTTTIGSSTAATISSTGVLTVNNVTNSSSNSSGALIVTGGVGIAKSLYVGPDSVNITPNNGDIVTQLSFSGANNQATAANITGLLFSTTITRSFRVQISVVVIATTSLYAQYQFDGIYNGSTWYFATSFVGVDTLVTFSITNAGQIQYTSPSYTGFTSLTMKFRALTIVN